MSATQLADVRADEPDMAGPPIAPLVALTALALAAVGGTAAALRRRQPTPRRKLTSPPAEAGDTALLHGILEAGRRLAAAEHGDDVERISVGQALAMTDGEAAAFLRCDAGVLTVGFATDPDLLVPARLADGVIGRVVDAGVEVLRVCRAEPALRNCPISLIAVPVFAAGSVVGALVVVRPAERPFAEADRLALAELRPLVGVAFDAARRTESANHGALVDALTGTGNRRRLDSALQSAGETPLSLIMIDFDHFKAVNDQHGHLAGDELLAAGASLVQQNIRPVDRLFRYGGEEFCVLVPEADESVAASVAERVRAALAAQQFVVGPTRVELRATASFGVAAGRGGEALIEAADQALYAAKRSGRNRVVRAGSLV